MPRKPKAPNSPTRKGRKSVAAPKWEREGFSSYRQYLNARYERLGFSSYSDYTNQRIAGKTPSTKKRAPEKPTGPSKRAKVAEVAKLEPVKQWKHSPNKPKKRYVEIDISKVVRTEFDSDCPFVYGIDEKVGAQIQTWLRSVIDAIERKVPADKIWSGAWYLYGRIAKHLDESGAPIFEPGVASEWSSHQDWERTTQEVISLGGAYGDHVYIEDGRQIGRGTSSIFAFIITKVRFTIAEVA